MFFVMLVGIGVLCGILIVFFIIVNYEFGFIIVLKGFVGVIFGGLVSYLIVVLGLVLVGLIESFFFFWVSVFKELIVFMVIIFILLWCLLISYYIDEEV